MTKLVMAFDSFYGLESFEGRQAVAQFRTVLGVQSLKVYRAVDSKPTYSVELECEDDKVEELKKHIQGSVSGYAGYVSNFGVRTLKELTL